MRSQAALGLGLATGFTSKLTVKAEGRAGPCLNKVRIFLGSSS